MQILDKTWLIYNEEDMKLESTLDLLQQVMSCSSLKELCEPCRIALTVIYERAKS